MASGVSFGARSSLDENGRDYGERVYSGMYASSRERRRRDAGDRVYRGMYASERED